MKIKNLVVNNLSKIASVACIVGFQAVLLVTAKNSEPQEDSLKLYCTTDESKVVEFEQPIMENDPVLQSFNLDYMIATADEKLIEIEEQHQQEYIDNLIETYYEGYDTVADVEVDNETFEITFGNPTYEYLSEEDFYFFMANVCAECKACDTHDALATASSLLNRCVSANWVNYLNNCGLDGTNPIDHIMFPGQYNVYMNGSYIPYLNGNVSSEVYDACVAAWYNGVRSHNFCSFRSSGSVGYSDNQVVPGGNRFASEVIEIEVDEEKPSVLELTVAEAR